MSIFRVPNARLAAVALANRRAALKAQEIRTEAVLLAPVGKSRPGYTGGRLRQSINVQKVGEGHYKVGTPVDYAIWVEFGTRHNCAQPFLRPALEKVRGTH